MEQKQVFYVRAERIYMEDGCADGLLQITDGRITALLPPEAAEKLPSGQILDARGMQVIPGIFDTHNHGTCGYSLESTRTGDENVRTVHGYLKACASQGITSVFPTPSPGMISAVAETAAGKPDGARILGIHSEGPWLARVGEGGTPHPCEPASLQTARKLWEDAGGLLRLVSFAPEVPGIWPVADFFLSRGVTLGAAHSNNRYAAAMDAYNRGIRVATHTGNVMTDMHHRDIGGLGAALTHPDVQCEVICDGNHICNEMLRIYFRQKDYSRFMMISDSTAYCGAPVGEYILRDGTRRHLTRDGQVLTDSGRRCGSARSVLSGIRNLTQNLGLPLETALEMACLTPARFYGFGDRKGSLRVGKDADLVILSDRCQVLKTICAGRTVYDRKTDGAILNPDFTREYGWTGPESEIVAGS